MVSSDTDSRGRHHGHRHRRSRDRDRSRSRGRVRVRERSRDTDFRPHLLSRSRSRERRYRSRSHSRERYRYQSPVRHHDYDGSPGHYYARDASPPPHWHPGAGGAGPPGGDELPWTAEADMGGPGYREQWHHEGEPGVYAIPSDYYDRPNWGAHDDRTPPPPPGWQHPDNQHYAQHNSYPDHKWGRPRSREHSSDWGGPSRGGSGLEGDFDMQREIEWQRRFGEQPNPTASIFIKGLPEDAEESDIYQLFEAYPNIQSVKVLRDRTTGRSKCMAFVDFASSDDARMLMESEYRWSLNIGGRPLMLDYSHGTPSSRPSGGPGDASAADWICDMCSAVNFARRLECYHCYTARPANPRRVMTDLNEPSNILKISGLEPHTSEEGLFQFLAAIVPNIVDMRVIKDKFTGAPRGFAFVTCPTIAEAGSLMVARQGQVLPGQSTPLKICYAKAKESLLGSAEVAWQGPDAAAAATAVGQAAAAAAATTARATATAVPLGWKPKEFDVTAVLDGGAAGQQNASNTGAVQQNSSSGQHASASGQQQQPALQQQQPLLQHQQPGTMDADHAAASAGAGTAAVAAVAQAASSQASSSAAAAAAAGVDAATIQALTHAGFEYQTSSGYWYDAKTGYYYDAKTQLYYHHSTNQWYKYDHSTGQYSAVGGEQQQQQGQEQQQQPVMQHTGATGAQQPAAGAQQGAAAPKQQQDQKQQSSGVDKRRRAVIGSKPQYNREGLEAHAALAKEREEEQKRIAAAKAARERQQQQQNKATVKQQLAPGKPGIGALPGTGAVAAPAAPAVPPPAAQVVADDGKLQGVVYKSKWAQRQQR